MAIDVEGGAAPAPSAPGPAPDPGHAPAAEGTPDGSGHPTPAATAPEHPEGKPASGRWTDLSQAERDYKALQAHATRATQALAQLGNLDDVQAERQFLQDLRADPEFLAWAQARVATQRTGAADPDTQRALQIIEQIAEEKAAARVAPLEAAAVEQRIGTVFSQMERQHGPEWQAYKPVMQAILLEGIRAGHFAPDVETRFDLRFVNGLYAMATASDPTFAAKQYEHRLAQKRAATSTSTPGTAPGAVGAGPARTIEEAFAQAKRQLGG